MPGAKGVLGTNLSLRARVIADRPARIANVSQRRKRAMIRREACA